MRCPGGQSGEIGFGSCAEKWSLGPEKEHARVVSDPGAGSGPAREQEACSEVAFVPAEVELGAAAVQLDSSSRFP